MTFEDFFKDDLFEAEETKLKAEKPKAEKKTAEQILRDNGYKIKLVIPTTFGTEYVMARKYPANELKKLFKDAEIKGNSVFLK